MPPAYPAGRFSEVFDSTRSGQIDAAFERHMEEALSSPEPMSPEHMSPSRSQSKYFADPSAEPEVFRDRAPSLSREREYESGLESDVTQIAHRRHPRTAHEKPVRYAWGDELTDVESVAGDDEPEKDEPEPERVEPEPEKVEPEPPSFHATGAADIPALEQADDDMLDLTVGEIVAPEEPEPGSEEEKLAEVEPQACALQPLPPGGGEPPIAPVVEEEAPPKKGGIIGAFFLIAFLLTWATLD